MKILIMTILMVSFAQAEDLYKSLSCSKKETGTQIFYINGMNTPEEGEDSAFVSADRIKELIRLGDKRKIDANQKVFVELIYNNSEGFELDMIQVIAQKIAETGQIPNPRMIASYLFRGGRSCLANPVVCAGISAGMGLLLLKQAYISGEDIRQMADLFQQHLNQNYKVILVSHSQGNLYANMVYDELLRRGVSSEILDKYYANLQVATAASYVRAKNHRIYLSKGDLVINSLRLKFPSTIQGNYSVTYTSDCPGGHNMMGCYLSDQVDIFGPKQGKPDVVRKASDVFLDNLEEVAWMLANNNESCCDGRDGRLHVNKLIDDSEEVGGFVEKSARIIADDAFIDKDSMICGNVNIDKKIEGGVDTTSILLSNSTILSEDPIVLSGIVNLIDSNLYNYGNANKVLSLLAEGEGMLIVNDTNIAGPSKFSGEMFLDHATISGEGKYSGKKFVFNGYSNFPTIKDSTLVGTNDVSGFYFLERYTENSIIAGKAVASSTGDIWNTLQLKPDPWGLINVEVRGIGTHYGKYSPGTKVISSGATYDDQITTADVGSEFSQARVTGSGYIVNSKISLSTVNLNKATTISYLNNAIIYNSHNINAFLDMRSSLADNTTITGTPVIRGTRLFSSTVTCNAILWNEGDIVGGSYGCGYVTPEDKYSRSFVEERNLEVMRKSFQEYMDVMSSGYALLEERNHQLRRRF